MVPVEPKAELVIPGVDVPPSPLAASSQPSQLRAGFRDPAVLPAIGPCRNTKKDFVHRIEDSQPLEGKKTSSTVTRSIMSLCSASWEVAGLPESKPQHLEGQTGSTAEGVPEHIIVNPDMAPGSPGQEPASG